ncbi:MAG TPA: homogentisate 1,2-dioxygenase [Gammaproteobacteria bacterium]|nr:homogentisate 1,2-dioxygenase [Gammaproteobacteria bacterium]
MATDALKYQAGFGNEFQTEAEPGALPIGRSNPQAPPFGLYTEEINGTPFTAPRGQNRRSWTYRIRPSATHKPFRALDAGTLRSAPFDEVPASPNQLRWRPLPIPTRATDFVAGLVTFGGNGDAAQQTGCAVHMYAANASMHDRFFYDADGELLIAPQLGRLTVRTELGVLEVAPGEICVVPRGIKFRVELPDGEARGYVCENYGPHFRLPELGPIGTNGLANARDFMTPVAAYEDRDGDFRVVAKFSSGLWEAEIDHSPLDVVAWHGTYAPYKYDLGRFNAMNTVSYDHPDPSIYCVLAAPTAIPGTSNIEVGLIADRWTVARETFRPPPFHRNVCSEFVGLVQGRYIGKGDSFEPGCASLHNCMSGHGPDKDSFERGSSAGDAPQYLENTKTIIFETQLVIKPTRQALESELLERDYYLHWQGLEKRFRRPK